MTEGRELLPSQARWSPRTRPRHSPRVVAGAELAGQLCDWRTTGARPHGCAAKQAANGYGNRCDANIEQSELTILQSAVTTTIDAK